MSYQNSKTILLTYSWTKQAQNFESKSESGLTVSILTDRCTIKILHRSKGNSEDWRVARIGG